MSIATKQGADHAISWKEASASKQQNVSKTQVLAKRFRRHQLRDTTGAGSLYQTALWYALQHLDDLSAEHLIGLPGSIQGDLLAAAASVPGFLRLSHWMLFRSLGSSLDVPHSQQTGFECTEEKDNRLRMAERVKLLSAPAHLPTAWFVVSRFLVPAIPESTYL